MLDVGVGPARRPVADAGAVDAAAIRVVMAGDRGSGRSSSPPGRHSPRARPGSADALADCLGEAAGEAFAQRWRRRPLLGRGSRVTAVAHPEVGILRLATETLQLSDRQHQRLAVHLPADAATAAGLDRLAGRRPGALRSVGTQR